MKKIIGGIIATLLIIGAILIVGKIDADYELSQSNQAPVENCNYLTGVCFTR